MSKAIMELPQLGKELFEQDKEMAQDIAKVVETYNEKKSKDDETVKLINLIKDYQDKIFKLVDYAANKENHNGQGALQMYGNFLSLMQLYQQNLVSFKRGIKYEGTKLGGKKFVKSMGKKLEFVEKTISYLTNKYADEILNGTKASYDLAVGMVKKYKI